MSKRECERGREQGKSKDKKSGQRGKKQEEESGEELGATAMQWGMACGNKSCAFGSTRVGRYRHGARK